MEHASSLLYLLILSLIATSQCSHFRGGTFQWSANANSKTVTFNLFTYWRSDYVEKDYTVCFGELDENGQEYCKLFSFNENSSTSPQWTTVSGKFSYTYQNYNEEGYLVSFSGCCRLSTFKTGADDPYTISALVKLNGEARQSGSISVPPVVDFKVGKNVLRIPTSYPVSSWSFGSSDKTGLGTNAGDYPYPNFIFDGPTLAPEKGVNNIADLTWITTADHIGQYPVSVSANTEFGSVSIDFIINVVDAPAVSNPPSHTVTPNGNYDGYLPVFVTPPGETVEYSISCSGQNPDAKYTFYTPMLYPGMKINGDTQAYITGIPNGQQVSVSYTSSITLGGDSQAYVNSFFCMDETTTEIDVFYTSIYVVVPLVLTPPPAAYTDCRGNCDCLPLFGMATATDGCCGEPSITYTDAGDKGSCGAVVTRTWFATNNCGQKANATQIIHINDNINPTWTSTVSDRNVQCFADKDRGVIPPSASDNCSKPVTVTYKDTFYSNTSCKNSVVRKWTAKDTCGNTITTDQKINVNDTVRPTISVVVEKFPVVECPSQKGLLNGVVRATDNCGEPVNLTFSDNPSDLLCGTFVRTYTAVDVCSNVATRPLTFTIGHKNPPTITLSNSYTYPQCGRELASFPRPTAVSHCGAVLNVTLVSSTLDCGTYGDTGSCCKHGVRTWTAVDECGNSKTIDEPIPISDYTPPYFCSFPPDVTKECVVGDTNLTSVLPKNTGTPTADDNCGLKSVTYEDDVTRTTCLTTINRKWTATDFCGNTFNKTQVIRVVDKTPPVFAQPPPATGVCPADKELVPLVSQFTDCTRANITCTDSIISSKIQCTDRVILRQCVVFDQCKNIIRFNQTITINDTIKPEIHVPCDTTVECKTKINPLKTGEATATDNCGLPVAITYDDHYEGNTLLVRVWVATDACGNTATGNQTIKFNNSNILLTCPADKNLVCRVGIYPNVTGYASASDLCTGNLTPEWSDKETPGCPSVISRTWTVSNDITQKTEACTQTITIGKDKPGPNIKAPRDTTVQCKKDARPDNTGYACASSLCYEDTFTPPDWEDTYSGTECDTDFKITRLWKTKDQCGKFSYDTQIIHIYDTEKPLLEVPPTCNVTCRFNTTVADCGKASSVDNCDDGYNSNVKITYSDDVTPSDKLCPSKILRTWRSEDCSGNVETQVQEIIISESAPVFMGYPPENLPDIECEDCFTYTPLFAKDSCGNTIPAVASITKEGQCPMTIKITWTATDSCGRTSTFVQTVKVDDKTPPVIDTYEPTDVSLECFYQLEVGSVTARDNCAGVGIPEFIDVSDDGNCTCTSCARSITRTWTVKDKCGNSATPFLQKIIAKKSQGPSLVVPSDRTIRCGDSYLPDLAGTGKAIAYDSCLNALYVSHTDKEETFSDGTIVVTRTWIAFDDCGNNATGVQKITIDGSRAAGGFVFKVPASRNLPCGARIAGTDTVVDGDYLATQSYDDYSKDLFLYSGCGLMSVENSVLPGCPNGGTYKREWRALRNGVVIDRQYTEYHFDNCLAHSAGIEKVSQVPTPFYGTAPINPKITIFDLDLPCEVITLVWKWGDGLSDTQKCDPNAASPACVFSSGNQLVASFPHVYKTAGVFQISVALYGQRSEQPDNTYHTTFITINPWLGSVAGSISFQAFSAESSYTSKCNKPWVILGASVPKDYTDDNVYTDLGCKAGIARLCFSATFQQNNGSYSAYGSTSFSFPSCFNGLSFEATNITHLSLSGDSTVAVWTGVGKYSAAPGQVTFTVYALDRSSLAARDKVHLRIKDSTGKILVDTDPCFPEVDWQTIPTVEPNFVYATTAGLVESGVVVKNEAGTQVSALGGEDSGFANGVSAGLIAGIVVGLLLFIVLVAGVVYFLLSRSSVAATGKSDQFISM